MITIYNKVDKTMENTSGIQLVPNIDVLEKPFLLCLSSRNDLSKSIFGIMREGAQAARVQTTQGPAGRFMMDSFPIDFLGVRFEPDENYQSAALEIADRFLYPFLLKNGRDKKALLKQARMINVFTYCEGVYIYKDIEDRISKNMINDGFEEEIVIPVLEQLSLVALQANIDGSEIRATSVLFLDINDPEVENEKTESYRNTLLIQGQKTMYSALGLTNGVLYIYDGNGIHSVKKFFLDDFNKAKPAVCSIVSMFLENSLQNKNSEEFYGLDIPQIISRLSHFADEAISPRQLLDRLDDALSYDGAPRYTVEAAEVKMELDAVYKVLRKTNEAFIRNLNDKEGINSRLRNVIRGIDEFSSHTTYEQILTYAHLLKPKEGEGILSQPSDKQVRAAIEEATIK